jgi:hypothetical protein
VAALPEIPQPKQIASNEFENIRAPVSPTLAKNMAWDEEGSRKLAKTDKLSSELSFTDFQKRRRMSPSPVRKLERDGPNTPRPTHSPQNDRLDTSERTEQLSKLEMFKKKSEEVDQLIPKSKRVTLQYSSPAAFDQKITPNYPKSDRHCVLPVNLEESSELSASINHAEIDQVLSKILTDLKSSEDFDHVGNNQILEGLQEEGIEAGNLKNAVAEIYHQNDFFAKNLGPQDEIGYLELAKSIQIIEKGHCKKVLSESFAELIINKNQAALTAKVVRLMDHLIHKSSDQMKSALQALKKVPSKTILSKLDQARAALGLPPSLKDQGVGTPRYQSLVNANLSPQKLDAYTSQLIVAHTAKVRELQVKGR